jgi:hypothetical protein
MNKAFYSGSYGIDMWRNVLRILLSAVVFVFTGALSISLLSRRVGAVSYLVPFLAVWIVWFLTRQRTKLGVSASTSDQIGGGAPIASAQPRSSVKQLQRRMWSSVAAFILVVLGIFAWSYLSVEGKKTVRITDTIRADAERRLGDTYRIDEVLFPSGTGNYEYLASIMLTHKVTGAHDMATFTIRGDCDKGCAVGIDPRDAIRLTIPR